MKKRIWISFFVILGIFFLIEAILNDVVLAENENNSSYSYDYYNIEGVFDYSRQGSLLYPYGLGNYSLRGYPMQSYVLANYSQNPYSLGSYLYRNIGGGYPMQNYVLANYGFSGFGGFY